MTAPSPERPSEESAATRRALEILAFAFVFPVATYLGFLAGGWVGARLGAPTAGGIVGGVVGAVAGFVELYRAARRVG